MVFGIRIWWGLHAVRNKPVLAMQDWGEESRRQGQKEAPTVWVCLGRPLGWVVKNGGPGD